MPQRMVCIVIPYCNDNPMYIVEEGYWKELRVRKAISPPIHPFSRSSLTMLSLACLDCYDLLDSSLAVLR